MQRDSHQLRHGRLGVFAVAFFVISAAAPLTAMAGGAPVAMLLGNGPGIPLAYVVVSVILLIFAVATPRWLATTPAREPSIASSRAD